MSIFLVICSGEHTCKGCGKTIKAGETAVKTKTSESSCSQTELHSVYYHESCWIAKRRKL